MASYLPAEEVALAMSLAHHYHSSYGPVLGAILICCVIAWLLGYKNGGDK